MDNSQNNKRIIKNTLMLYVRMLFSMFVSFYTSRVILDVLGITDFGINNVVAGVAGMFAFINTSLAGATSRFLTFDLGLNDIEKLKKTFSAALTIHVILALLIFILCETVGVWILETKLVIPENRMFAARIIFQLSVLSCKLMITQVPYNAVLIAHERMDVYAYFGIADVFLKLGIVFLLQWIPFDKLITYGVLFFILSGGMMMAYRYYGTKHFEECRWRITSDKKLLKPLLLFSGCDVYGNMCVMFRGQGINILQNMFWGPAINAATGVSQQILNAILGFSRNFTTAIQPQIVKFYAQENYLQVQLLATRCAKFSFFLLFVISFPALLKVNFVMNIWLKEVPDYAFVFCQLAIVVNWFDLLNTPLNMIIHATGKMKRISFITGSIFLFTLPLTYLFLKMGYSPTTPFWVNIFITIVAGLHNLYLVKLYIPEFKAMKFLQQGVLYPLGVVSIGAIIPILVNYSTVSFNSIYSFFIVCFSCVICELLSFFYLGLNAHEKIKMKEMIKSKFQRKK